jgi:hypothetical protein
LANSEAKVEIEINLNVETKKRMIGASWDKNDTQTIHITKATQLV